MCEKTRATDRSRSSDDGSTGHAKTTTTTLAFTFRNRKRYYVTHGAIIDAGLVKRTAVERTIIERNTNLRTLTHVQARAHKDDNNNNNNN